MDAVTFPPLASLHREMSSITTGTQRVSKGNGGSSSNVRKGMMAFFETFQNKQATTS